MQCAMNPFVLMPTNMNDQHKTQEQESSGRVEVILAWDDVFGLHLQVPGDETGATSVAECLKAAQIKTTAERAVVARLQREGCVLVLLREAGRDERAESKLRAALRRGGFDITPGRGVERVASPYGERVRALLRRGSYFDGVSEPSAAKLGLGVEHGPELLRLALDAECDQTSLRDAAWGPVWAWFVLAELKPEGAKEVLLQVLGRMSEEGEDDAPSSVLPLVFGDFGPEILPELKAFVEDRDRYTYARWAAAEGMAQIALAHGKVREEIVGALSAVLGDPTQTDPEMNGALVDNLLTLNAVEAADVIERAYAERRVDQSLCGDWEHVQVALRKRRSLWLQSP